MRVHVEPAQIAAAFAAVKHDPVFAESAALYEQGRPPAEMIQAMCLRPEFLAAFVALSNAVYPGGVVERDIKELIILESSRLNQCQFCTNSHIEIAKMLGITNDPIGMLDDPASLNDRQRVAIEYTRSALADSNRVPDDLFERLRTHFAEPEIVELTIMIGYINMLNLFNNCLRVTYRGEYDAIES
ncbi:MAG: carboxymuconolactone decarboxylase family protein [Planctomycetota bacterium]|jgi:AhpD family alkylhydroperoxidase